MENVEFADTVSDEYTGLACKPEEVNEFIKTQSLFLATPVYGGNSITVNYVKSLTGLLHDLQNLGVNCYLDFKYNESLIARARNKIVGDFRKSECTHLLFCDCDIGFEPADVISLLLQKEQVIGAPCVKKNINWDRIQQVIKSNGQVYTGDDLQKIAGDFGGNFPPGKRPDYINLGALLEVQDVGTGLMLIHRNVFDKIEKAFPDEHYLQLEKEGGGRELLHMFFQSGIDEESKLYNPGGFPDYISEDYGFCRRCRKAGIKVWLAPFMKTTHFGTFLYMGDMEAVCGVGGKLR